MTYEFEKDELEIIALALFEFEDDKAKDILNKIYDY
jgi:hypothetical protein